MNFSFYLDFVSVSSIAISVASVAQLGEEDVADTILSLVQNVGYVLSDYSFQHTLYPVETLAHGGVCDDLSVLYASMMTALGFRVIFLWYPEQWDLGGSKISHVSVAVHLTSRPEHSAGGIWYFTHEGLDYYTAETTGQGWRLGDLPESLRGQKPYVEEAKPPSTHSTATEIITSTTTRYDYEVMETVSITTLFGYLIVAIVVAALGYEVGRRKTRPPITPPPRETVYTKYCRDCGARIPHSANYCIACGAKQTV